MGGVDNGGQFLFGPVACQCSVLRVEKVPTISRLRIRAYRAISTPKANAPKDQLALTSTASNQGTIRLQLRFARRRSPVDSLRVVFAVGAQSVPFRTTLPTNPFRSLGTVEASMRDNLSYSGQFGVPALPFRSLGTV